MKPALWTNGKTLMAPVCRATTINGKKKGKVSSWSTEWRASQPLASNVASVLPLGKDMWYGPLCFPQASYARLVLIGHMEQQGNSSILTPRRLTSTCGPMASQNSPVLQEHEYGNGNPDDLALFSINGTSTAVVRVEWRLVVTERDIGAPIRASLAPLRGLTSPSRH